jgi:membrane fusion protein (multidrug efflux system)
MRPAVLLLSTGLLVAAASVSACKKPQAQNAELTSAKQEAAAIHAELASVVTDTMPEYLTLTGTLRASEESEVAADVAGKVTATFAERGQAVKKGDTLAIVDARGASLVASAAAAQTNLAKAQLEQAQRECQRVKQLFQTGAISQAEYDRTTSQCATGQFAAAAAQAQQQSAQKLVGDSVIRAPFAGVVGERFVSVGQYVQAATKVVSLYAPDPLRLELTVPEANIGALKADMPVKFTVSAYGEQPFEGRVKFISPNVRPSTRDLVIEALCPNADGRLRPGMFAVAQLEVGQKKLPVVPKAAVVKDDSGSAHVFAVVDGIAQERLVQLGGDRDGRVGVVVGIKEGEKVVVKPGPDVHDGVQVAK